MNAAIVVIDMQEDFFAKEYLDRAQGEAVKALLVKHINRLLSAARENRLAVFLVTTSMSADTSNWNLRAKDLQAAVCIQGTAGEALAAGIQTAEDDIFVTKERYSAFFRTNLDELLQARQISTLVMCGINTHACVRTSAVDAFMRDYRVFMPLECAASYDLEQHDSSLTYMSKRIAKIVPLQEMIERIENKHLDFQFNE